MNFAAVSGSAARSARARRGNDGGGGGNGRIARGVWSIATATATAGAIHDSELSMGGESRKGNGGTASPSNKEGK